MALRGEEMNKKGQMHTIEALLALMLIIGVVAFAARSAPGETQVESNVDTQLLLYGEDVLSILDMADRNHESWLYDLVKGTYNCADFECEWEHTNLTAKKGVFYKLELLNTTKETPNVFLTCSPYGNPPENAVTVTRLVTLVNPQVDVYEVRLTLWYV
jgi:hypothetical protein